MTDSPNRFDSQAAQAKTHGSQWHPVNSFWIRDHWGQATRVYPGSKVLVVALDSKFKWCVMGATVAKVFACAWNQCVVALLPDDGGGGNLWRDQCDVLACPEDENDIAGEWEEE